MTYSIQRPLKLPTKSARLQAESKALWNEARKPAGADFFTIGYQGRTVKEVLSLLRSADVSTLLDIRYNPVSMYKPEFSKSNLQRTMNDAGIWYSHFREWGVPREVRARAMETGNRDAIWSWYDSEVVDVHFGRNLHRFLNLGHPVCLMCMEHDPAECHRHRIFIALESQGLKGFDL